MDHKISRPYKIHDVPGCSLYIWLVCWLVFFFLHVCLIIILHSCPKMFGGFERTKLKSLWAGRMSDKLSRPDPFVRFEHEEQNCTW